MSAHTGATIVNCVNLICWTVLAWLFGEWWIALFAYFFMMNSKRGKETKEET